MSRGMRNRTLLALFGLACLTMSCSNIDTGPPDEVAVLETNYGRIVFEFFPTEAPRHVANFKELTREGFFDGTKLHRIVKDKARFVAIQGGDPNTRDGDPSTWGQGQPGQRTIPAEFSPRLRHLRGAVSMARRQNDINSGTSQFFICVTPEPKWDGHYSIFGRVIEGMAVVDTISRAPVWPNSDRPMDPVVVNRAYLTRLGDLTPQSVE